MGRWARAWMIGREGGSCGCSHSPTYPPMHFPNVLVISLAVCQSVSVFVCLANPTENDQKKTEKTLYLPEKQAITPHKVSHHPIV